MRKHCMKCWRRRFSRNHLATLCDDCAEAVAQYLDEYMKFNPASEAERILMEVTGNDEDQA